MDRTRQEAETYAEARRLEADQLVIDVREEARSKADALLDHARSEVGAMQDRWRHVERSLGDAASGISAALEAVRRLSGLAGGEPIDVAEAEQAGAEGSGRLRYLLPRLAGGEG